MKALEDFGVEMAEKIRKRATREYSDKEISREDFDKIDKKVDDIIQTIEEAKN